VQLLKNFPGFYGTRRFITAFTRDYITKLCRTQAEVILNHINSNVRGTGQGKTRRRKYKRLKLGGGESYDRSADCSFIVAT
jgi:hypothetical protein